MDGEKEVKKARPKRTIWALDVICWGDNSYAESEFDCRQFMLKSRLEENPLTRERSSSNPYSFVGLPWCYSTKEGMTELMNRDYDFELDGLLFYSPKVILLSLLIVQVLYIPGQNAMIGWLEPWMMPEILQIPIPKHLQKDGNPEEHAREYMARFESEKSTVSMYASSSGRYAGRLNVQNDTEMNDSGDISGQSEALDLSIH